MLQHFRIYILASIMAFGVSACGGSGQPPPSTSYGSDPVLPKPDSSLIPSVNVAPAKPWTDGQKPTAPAGFEVRAYAKGLDHPRWIYVLPNGDVLVAETNAPKRPEDEKGFKSKVMRFFQKKAGAHVPSADRITLLRDEDGDGEAETRDVFLENLVSPFGMALVGTDFYVANTNAVLRFPYEEGMTSIKDAGKKVTDLPAGPRNHHWTKNIIASPDGKLMYATVGSNSNNAENGLEEEEGRAAIWEIDLSTDKKRLFATGLRNPNGMGWQPDSGQLWVSVNERDELGNDLVPDYMTAVRDGAFYGWPYSYFGQHVDERMKPQNAALVASAVKPDYALGAHTASLGLTFYDGKSFPEKYAGGAFVGQHGSWNRDPHSGYKVIFVPFKNGRPAGQPEDFLIGFLNEEGDALGRPVGVAVDKTGALLVADDTGNTIWRVAPIR